MTHAEPEICSCSAVRQASRHLSRIYDEALAPAGLGINQYSILSRLERFGPLSQVELAARLVMDRSTLGHLLGPLRDRALVDVDADPGDRRRKLLSLSDDGRRLLARAQPLWAEAQRSFERSFGRAESDTLRRIAMDVTNTTVTRPPAGA
jgi:DNA-binding MarR family transcriptional regulator